MDQVIKYLFQVQTTSKPTDGSPIVWSWRAETMPYTFLFFILMPFIQALTPHNNLTRLTLYYAHCTDKKMRLMVVKALF